MCRYSSWWFNNLTADWLCRLMGYQSLIKWENRFKYSWQSNYTTGLQAVKCEGSELPECKSANSRGLNCYNRYYTNDIWLSCKERQVKGDLDSFYLLDKDGQYTESGQGLLMHKGGTVCDDKFDDAAADWICRLMGFWAAVSWTHGSVYLFQGNLSIVLDDIECTKWVDTLNFLPSCRVETDTSGCTHTEDVFLNCISNPMCPAGSYWSIDQDQCAECPADTVSKEGSMSLSQCVLCPLGSSPINNGKACSCDKGYGWVWATARNHGACNPCPANTYKDYELGICVRCPVEATSAPLSEDCQCPAMFSWDSKTKSCIDCAHVDDWNCVKVCPAGRFWNMHLNMCNDCPVNTYSIQGDRNLVCLQCPDNSTAPVGSVQCTCTGYSFFSSELRSCVACPTGSVSRKGASSPSHCIPCRPGSVPLSSGLGCSCRKGYGWVWTEDFEGTCKSCPATTYNNHDQGICTSCPTEATSLPQSEECHCPSGLDWDGAACVDCTEPTGYKSGLCSCFAGTFWNLDTKRCEKCPENHHSDTSSLKCTKCRVGFSQNGDPRSDFTCDQCPDHHVGNGVDCVMCPEGTIPSEDRVFCQQLQPSHEHILNLLDSPKNSDKVSLVNIVLLSTVAVGVVVIIGIAVAVYLYIKKKRKEELYMIELAAARQRELPLEESIYVEI